MCTISFSRTLNRIARLVIPPPGGLRLIAVLVIWVMLIALSGLIDSLLARQPLISIGQHLFALWEGRGSGVIFFVAFVLALCYAAGFLQQLYAVDNYREAWWRLVDMLFDLTSFVFSLPGLIPGFLLSILGFFRPTFIVIRGGQVDKDDEKSAAAKIGGPAYLVIYEDSAVALERDGRFSRIVGPGIKHLEPFETVRTVVDLRRQVQKDVVHGLTKDGIPIQLDLEVEFQIQPWSLPCDQRDTATPKTPYPFREWAVRRAVYNAIAAKDRVFRWDRIVWLVAMIQLRSLLRQRVLDKLLEPEDGDPQALLTWENSPRWEMQVVLHRRLQPVAHLFGATVLRVTLGTVQIDVDFAKERIEKERIEVWQAEWKRRTKVIEKESEAEAARLKEIARAQAQADMVTAIARALPPDIDHTAAQKIIALRMLESLEEMALDPSARRFLPEETILTLRSFHQVLQTRAL